MFSNWRYVVGAFLFLASGLLFLFIVPRWGLSRAYIVSLPIFAVGLFFALWAIRKTK